MTGRKLVGVANSDIVERMLQNLHVAYLLALHATTYLEFLHKVFSCMQDYSLEPKTSFGKKSRRGVWA